MSLLHQISRGLHIQPGETHRVLWSFVHSFLAGAAMELAYTAAAALFLQRFSPGLLPWVYIAVAVTGSVATTFASHQPASSNLRRFLCGLLLLTAAGLVALRFGHALSGSACWIFALLVWAEVAYRLIRIESNLLAGDLFDIRQNKRLFGLIEAGSLCAQIAAGAALALLAHHFQLANLFYLSAAMLLAAGLIVLFLYRQPRNESASRLVIAGTRPATSTMRHLFANIPSVRLAACAGALFVVAYYVIDNAFYREVSTRFPDGPSMAAFLGGISVVTGLLGLLCLTLFSSRLLARLGIQAGLLLLPLGLLLPALPAGLLPCGNRSLFWLAVLLLILRDVLYAAFTVPSDAIVLQALPVSTRTRVQTMLTGMVNPIASGLCGAGLIALFGLTGAGTADLARVLLCILVLWALVSRRQHQAYIRALQHALSSRRLGGTPLNLKDAATRALIIKSMDPTNSTRTIHALDLLQEAGDEQLESVLISLLDAPLPEVRREAGRRLGEHIPVPECGPIRRHFETETDPGVRAALLTALIRTETPEAVQRLLPWLDAPDPSTRQAALTALLLRPDSPAHGTARRRLSDCLRSPTTGQRRLAAVILTTAYSGEDAAPLAALLSDPETAVRRAAIETARHHPDRSFVPALLASLHTRGLRRPACAALCAMGPAIVPALAPLVDAPDSDTCLLRRLAQLLGQAGGTQAVRLLEALTTHRDEHLRHAALQGLAQLARALPVSAPNLEALLRREAAEAAWLCACATDLECTPADAMLTRAIENLQDRLHDRILLILACMFPLGPALTARRHLSGTTSPARALAFESLDASLPGHVRAEVAPLIEVRSMRERAAGLLALHPQPHRTRGERLRELADGRPDWSSDWTQAVAAHCIRLADGTPFGVERTARMLSIVERVLILKAVSIFADIPDEALADMGAQLSEIEAHAGQTIIQRGDEGTTLYILINGQARVHIDDRELAVLGERAVFGEFSALDPEPRSASVTALTDCTLFGLDQQVLYELLDDHPEVSHGIIRALVGIVRRHNAIGSQKANT